MHEARTQRDRGATRSPRWFRRGPSEHSHVTAQQNPNAAAIEALDADVAQTLFTVAESRRAGLDQMAWQAPALSFTAQAFLLTIAYDGSHSWTARLAAAGLGLAVALAGFQLLSRHRLHETRHSVWLEMFSEARGWPVLQEPAIMERFAYPEADDPRREANLRRLNLARVRSTPVWLGTLALFAMANVLVLVAWIAHFCGSEFLY